jgi:peptidoglycan-associated lipoprotein
MLHRRGSLFLVAPLLVLALFLVGCPKRPATMTAGSAPAPTAAAPSTPSSPGMSSTSPAAAAPSTSPSTMTPSTAAPSTTAPGSMAGMPPKPSEFMANANLSDIHFDFDKYNIRAGDAKLLDANAAWLKSNPGNLVLIEGHCDERGTNEYNLALGERRAKSTMNYLVAQGVQAARITIISYGKERPLCTEHTEECWAKNRRAHFLTKAQ